MRIIRFIFIAIVGLLAHIAESKTWYVDAKLGKDTNVGHSEKHPFKTIQYAIDQTAAGDVVKVAEGVYFENIQVTTPGTKNQPITIMADKVKNKHVIITAADKAIRKGNKKWVLVDNKREMYRVALAHKPVRVLADNVDLLPYPSVEDLKAFKFTKSNYPGHKHGYAWSKSEQMLYVRIRADLKYNKYTDPNRLTMSVAPATGGGKFGNIIGKANDYNISILTNDKAHIVVDGITFETPGIGGLFTKSSDVTVRNSWFYGCRTGVAGNRSDSTKSKRANNIIIEHNYFTQFPAYSDIEDLIDSREYDYKKKNRIAKQIIHWQRKGNFPVGDGVGRAYAYEVGFVMNMGEGWLIRNNHLYEVFEGISAAANHHSKNTIITDNLFEKINDNGVETENRAQNMIINNNIFIDVYEEISWQPLSKLPLPGPIYITNNIFYQSSESKNLWEITTNWAGVFKFGGKDAFWNNLFKSPKPIQIPGGIWIVNNTILKPRGRLVTYLNSTQWPLVDINFLNNDILTWRTSTSKDLGKMLFDYNVTFPSLLNKTYGYTDNFRVAGVHGSEVIDTPVNELVDIPFENVERHHYNKQVSIGSYKPLPKAVFSKVKYRRNKKLSYGPN